MARRQTKRRSSRRSTRPKKMTRQFDGGKDVSPNDEELIRKLITDHGKIIPARLTGATAKQQRQVKRAVRRNRVIGLVP